jgi:DNA-binding beta-propeller fold protein YncE
MRANRIRTGCAVMATMAGLCLGAGAQPASAAADAAAVPTKTIPVGTRPDGIAVSPVTGDVYVTNINDNTVSEFG